jgi:hypothetical protein
MIGEFITIEVGQLFIVDRQFWTSGNATGGGFKVKRLIKKGTVIEIRYPYAWHFRTCGNTYDHATEKTLRSKCSFFGLIHDKVEFGNKHSLNEILKGELYHKPAEFKLKIKECK